VVQGGRQPTGIDAIEWVDRTVGLGAGEILLTSIDRDGTREGFDIELLRTVTSRVNVPVVASGGAGSPADMTAAVTQGNADAVLAASIFHRDIHSIAAVKADMSAAGVPVRLVEEAA
jgi:cyclase